MLLLIWSEKPAKTSLSDINTGQQCYSKKKFKNDKLINDLLLRIDQLQTLKFPEKNKSLSLGNYP